jgi:hypothetical protein
MTGGGPVTRVSRPTSNARATFSRSSKQQLERRTRNVFISFHIEDETQVDLLRMQSKDNEFGIHFRDYSVKEPFDEKWKTNCRERISQTSATIVMIGPETADREAVDWEIRESIRQGKKVIGVRIFKDENHRVPKALQENNCPIINWKLAEISKRIE